MAFASTLPSSRNKFSPRAVPAVFVGYPKGYKGYKLYSLDTKKFFVSIDVVFHELIFPFQTISQNQVILDSLLDLVIPIPLTNALPNPDQNTSQPTQTSISFIQNPSDLPLVPSPDQPDLLPSVTLRSTRHSKPPLYLFDYVTPKSKTAYLSNIIVPCWLLAPLTELSLSKFQLYMNLQFYHQAAPYPENGVRK